MVTPGRPQVTFSAVPLVAIKIRGELRKFPQLPVDGGLVFNFLKWMGENDVHEEPVGVGHSGSGSYLGFFNENVVPRIRTWLLKNGVVEDDEKTWGRR